MSFITEPSKQVPVLDDVDVVVAGAGVAGTFAAIAAARKGARTILVDRFGSVGGNIGPGMIVNGHMVSGSAHATLPYQCTVYPHLYGIGHEFVERYGALGGGCILPYTRTDDYTGDASIASYVAQKMCEESGVRLLLSTQVADPVMNGKRVAGLFVENKSGRSAIMAKAVIDATGEADVARRAGASMLYPKQEYSEVDGHSPTGMGIHFVVGGVDWDAYQASLTGVDVSDDDMAWAERQVRDQQLLKVFHGLIPGLRLENEKSGYLFETSVTLEGTRVGITMPSLSPTRMPGVLQGRTSIERLEVIDAGNGDHMAILEAAVRRHIFESFSFIKRNAGGFENASLLCIAPFLGSRGGPSIEGDYILTMDDCREGKLFDDVLLRYGEFRALRYTSEQGEPKWVDVPYRVFLPKRIEGLLAVGRAASGQPDTLLRNRMAAKVMGQAVGTAAAMAADEGLTPRALDVRRLQETLLDDGFHLGDRCRLRELCFP